MSLSSPQPMSLSHTRKRPRTGSYSSPQVVASASEATESEAVRSLAARVPPELFDDILFYVNINRASQRWCTRVTNLQRNRGRPSAKDILTDLKQCSLVCLFWANRCREHIFRDRTLEINYYEDAEIFRRYVVGGCPRLTPVDHLISEIQVSQGYDSRRSFLDLLYLPDIQDKLTSLAIRGPVPDSFNPAKLDTPHWGIPPHIIVSSSFLQSNIFLEGIHLPSLYHIIKYIKHFSCATYIKFREITWDGQMALSLPYVPSTTTSRRRPRSLLIRVIGFSTDSVHLALTALMLNPNCPMHRLSEEERVWMIKFMTLLWDHEKGPPVEIRFDVSEQATTMRLGHFDFAFEEAPATDRSASALSVVGIHAYIYNSDNLPANLDALVNHARTQPTIRALVLLFRSIHHLQKSMNPFVQVLTLTTETVELVLAYEKKEKCGAEAVDLVTLEPNGCVDIWKDEQSEYYYYGAGMSLQMLQRQLKKKRWMSVH
ncbi:hypothetical protein BC629DRAFT_1596844 [Irpex lacteus]|nr:hypothetical protein BC629DRAFT_1596844 [Irpex lacteus]